MAISLNSDPNLLTSSDRFVQYTVTSNVGTITRMKAQLKIDGTNEGSPTVLDPNKGTTNQFSFDFMGKCKANATGYDTDGLPTINGTTVFDADSSHFGIEVVFTELLTAALTTGATLTTSAGTNVINAIPQHEESQNLETTYALKASVADNQRRFLTNFSATSRYGITNWKKVAYTENEWLGAFFDENIDSTYTQILMEVSTYDVDGLIQTATIDVTDLQTHKRADLPVGGANLNAASLVSGSQPLITTATGVDRYTIKLKGDGTVISETLTYKPVTRKNCNTRLVWVNECGGLDWFTFEGDLIEGIESEHETFRRPLTYGFTVVDRGIMDFTTKNIETFTIYSQALPNKVKKWLGELLTSSLVYWELNGVFIPITITSQEKVTKERDNPFINFAFVKSNEILRQGN